MLFVNREFYVDNLLNSQLVCNETSTSLDKNLQKRNVFLVFVDFVFTTFTVFSSENHVKAKPTYKKNSSYM